MILRRSPHQYGPFWLHDTRVADLLCEPPPADNDLWGGSAARRLLVVSGGAVGVAPMPDDHRLRLERAGVPVVAETSDHAEVLEEAYPALPALRREAIGWGSPRPSLVLVGDRANYSDQPAFAALSGAWLLMALRELGYDELNVYLTNARTPRGESRVAQLSRVHEALAVHAPLWVALGESARGIVRTMGIPYKFAAHPSYFRRAKRALGVKGYAEELAKAGIQPGPWHGEELPTTPTTEDGGLPELDEDLWPITDCVRITPERKNRTSVRRAETYSRAARCVSATESAKVRQYYVSGQASTVKAAMRMAGVRSNKMYNVARAENWGAEKEEHARRKTRAFLEADVESEVALAKHLKEDTLHAARLAGANLLTRLREGTLEVTTSDLKRLVDAHLALSASSTGEENPEIAALRELTLPELAARVTDQLKALGGPEPDPEAEQIARDRAWHVDRQEEPSGDGEKTIA